MQPWVATAGCARYTLLLCPEDAWLRWEPQKRERGEWPLMRPPVQEVEGGLEWDATSGSPEEQGLALHHQPLGLGTLVLPL